MLVYIAGRDPGLYRSDGHSAYVRAHARAAVRAGYRPQILCVGKRALTRETEYGVIRMVRSPSPSVRTSWAPAHGRALTRALLAIVADVRGPLLVHGFGTWAYVAVRGCVRLRRRGRIAIPVVSSYATYRAESESHLQGLVDGSGASGGLRLSYRAQALWARTVVTHCERIGFRGAAAVFVNYDSVRRLIAAAHGSRPNVRLLPYAPEADFLEPSRHENGSAPPAVAALEPAQAPLVTSIAAHHPRKGIDVLIEALALARDRGTPLRACLIGDGPLLDLHRRRVREARLARSVAVPGVVADTEAYLRAAEIFVLPSRGEQSGSLAMLEALRAGVATIASRVDGIPEDVADGESAILVSPGDAGDLAGALSELAADPKLRARLAAGGRRRFSERFAAPRFVAALAAAYAELGLEPDS